ncbi:hypothetical protein ACIA8K_12415 [Catenuloplanes sp. NPDC051500]|uniref:hypothetical protein n=1 Tax=Catenuloplanes sp. NPDC051500 TaxID=3363959 RepID=UPI0037B3770F
MSDTLAVPASLAVRNMLGDTLGRDVTVNVGNPLTQKDLPTAAVAIYVDAQNKVAAVLGMDLKLAAFAGAALGLLPVGGAEDAIDDKELYPNLAENVGELCNILTGLLNKEGGPHIKLDRVVYPGESLPNDAQSQLLALGRRIDLSVEIARYGTGTFSLSLAGF